MVKLKFLFIIFINCFCFKVFATEVEIIKIDSTKIQDFEKLSITGSFELSYEQSSRYFLLIEAKKHIVPDISINNNFLEVNIKNGIFLDIEDYVKITIYSPNLNELNCLGKGKIIFKDTELDKLDINLKGGFELNMKNIKLNNLKLDFIGSMKVFLKNLNVTNLNIEDIGYSKIFIKNKGDMENVIIKCFGKTNILFTEKCHVKRANVKINGISELDIRRLFIDNLIRKKGLFCVLKD